MTERNRRAAENEISTTPSATRLRDRLRAPLVAVIAVSALVPALFATAPAFGGADGGVGPVSSRNTSGTTSPGYVRLWQGLRPAEKRWAFNTSECESGGNGRIHGGGGMYHGAFQFLRSTWTGAPKSPGGDPHSYSWRTQAVVAAYYKRRYGAGAWPYCG